MSAQSDMDIIFSIAEQQSLQLGNPSGLKCEKWSSSSHVREFDNVFVATCGASETYCQVVW